MKLPTDEMATLDLTEAHEKALEALEQLGRLARIADDPDAYTVAELQAAMDAAKYIEAYWGSGPVALEAEEVVAAFVAQVEARRACREHGLVPQAKYDEVCAQLEQAKAAQVHFSLDCRVAKPIESNAPPASIGIGDPLPPPPPTKARDAWTGETLHKARWAHLGADATDWARLDQSTRDQYDAIADAVNRQSEIDAKASREPVPALTLDDLAEAWTSAAIGRVIGYGPSSELLAALNEALARKSQP